MKINDIINEAQPWDLDQKLRSSDPDAQFYGGKATLDEPAPMRGTKPIEIPDYDPQDQMERNVEIRQMQQIIGPMLDKLPKKAAQILKLRFWSDMTLADISDRLGVTVERVRQLESKALRMLRHPSMLGGEVGRQMMGSEKRPGPGYDVTKEKSYQQGYQDAQTGQPFNSKEFVGVDRLRDLYRQGYIAGGDQDF